MIRSNSITHPDLTYLWDVGKLIKRFSQTKGTRNQKLKPRGIIALVIIHNTGNFELMKYRNCLMCFPV